MGGRMRLDVYESVVRRGYFVTVASGVSPHSVKLPNTRELSRLAIVRGGYELPTNIAVSAVGRSIQADIKRRGFTLHGFDLLTYEPVRHTTLRAPYG